MQPGDRIGDYIIVSRIGEGAISVVYLAERAFDRGQVIVKELRDQYKFNQQLVDRFLREAEVLQDLRHLHLARVFGLLEYTSPGRQLAGSETRAERPPWSGGHRVRESMRDAVAGHNESRRS